MPEKKQDSVGDAIENLGKVSDTLRDHSPNPDETEKSLVRRVIGKVRPLIQFQNAYELIKKVPEIYYAYRINTAREVLSTINDNPNLRRESLLLEQTLYGLLDIEDRVPRGHKKEYNALCEEIARAANLIQVANPSKKISSYRVPRREEQ